MRSCPERMLSGALSMVWNEANMPHDMHEHASLRAEHAQVTR
jgi:hypothetical protein